MWQAKRCEVARERATKVWRWICKDRFVSEVTRHRTFKIGKNPVWLRLHSRADCKLRAAQPQSHWSLRKAAKNEDRTKLNGSSGQEDIAVRDRRVWRRAKEGEGDGRRWKLLVFWLSSWRAGFNMKQSARGRYFTSARRHCRDVRVKRHSRQ